MPRIPVIPNPAKSIALVRGNSAILSVILMTMVVHSQTLHNSNATPTVVLGTILALAVVFVIGTVFLREPIATSFSSNLLPKMSDNRGS